MVILRAVLIAFQAEPFFAFPGDWAGAAGAGEGGGFSTEPGEERVVAEGDLAKVVAKGGGHFDMRRRHRYKATATRGKNSGSARYE